jgi:autotransporter-associated beta strand protein
MYGSGSLTLSNSASDNFTGGIDLEAGSLTLANPVGPSSLGSVTLNGSSLLTIANNAANNISGIALSSSAVAAFSQPTNVPLSAPLTGNGTLVKQGTNMLTLSANNSAFSGAMQVNGGVLRVGGSQALNGSGVSVANTATLDVNGIATSSNVLVTVQGSGVGGRGALDNGSSTAQPQALDNITLAADTTIGATGARWDTLSTDAGNGSSFAGNNFNLTKVGTNDFWLGVSGDTGLGDVAINEGLMGFEQGNLGNCTLGDSTKTITVRTNATLGFWQPNVAGDKQVALQDRASLMGGSAGVAEFGGSVSKLALNGTNRVWFALGGGTANPRAAGNLQCDSEITGGGVLTVDRQLFGAVASVGTFTLAGSNTFTSPVIVNDGALRLANNLAVNTNGTIVVKTNGVSGVGTGGTSPKVPHVEFSGGVTIPPGVTIHVNSASSNLVGTLDMRTALVVPNADVNEFQGTLIPHGDGNILITGAAAGSYLTLSGPITNTAFALPAGLAFNGAGSGTISGQVNINGEMEMNIGAAATWTYSGAGNHYAFLAIETGTTALGADNGLSTTDPVQMILSGTLDLAGFSQTVPSLTNTSTAKIGNSSTTSDSVLTINGPAIVSVIAGPIRDALGAGSKTVALTITNSKVQLNNAFNIYTGPTLVQNLGTLGGNGTLASAVTVQSGGTLSPGSSIGTLTINNTLTMSSGSTNFFEVDAGTLAHDTVAGLTSVSYAGTLVVSNVSLSPLSGGQSFKLFDAATYNGSFAAIVPATPGSGLQWDTNSLAVDGTLKVAAPASFTSITPAGSGNFQFIFTGPVGSPFSLLFSTNVADPISSWSVVTSGTITSSPFTVNDPAATNSTRYYRIRIP